MKKNDLNNSALDKTDKSEDRFLGMMGWVLILGVIVLFSYIFMKFEFEWVYGSRWDLGQTLPSQPGVLGLIVFLALAGLVTLVSRKKKTLFGKKELAAVYIALSVCGIVWQVGQWLPLALGSLPLTVIEDSARWGPVLDAASSLLFPLQTVEEAEAFYWGGMAAPFRQWFVPMLFWSMFAMAVGILCVSLAILFRRHWMEAMNFTWPYMSPVTTLVQGSSEDFSLKETRAFRLFMAGLLIGLLLIFFEWLKNIYPIIPFWDNLRTMDGYNRDLVRPIQSMVPFHARAPLWYLWKFEIYPTAFGVAYLVPLNVISSFVFVCLVKYPISVAIALYGINPDLPAAKNVWTQFYGSIVWGGMIALAVVSMYRARHMIREFLCMSTKESYEQEGIPSKIFLAGLIGSLLFIILFMMIGLHLPFLLVLSVLFISICGAIATARFRAEVGVPVANNPLSPTRHYLNHIVGGFQRFGGPFTSRAFLLIGERVFASWYGGGMSPLAGHTLDAYKLGEDTGLKTKHITKIVLIVTAFTILVSFYSGFPFLYSSQDGAWGGRMWAGWQGPVSTWRYGELYMDQLVDWGPSFGWASLAFILGVLIIGLRSIFSWWPLHPVGALLGVSDYMWKPELLVPFILVGFTKFVIFRYFGVRTYHAAKPFFIGLIIGPVIGRVLVVFLQFVRFMLH